MFPFLIIIFVRLAYSCFPTSPTNPIVTTTTAPGTITTTVITSTSTASGTTATPAPGCCPQLTESFTAGSEFPNGLFTFTYNSIACPTSVVANCSQTDPAFNLVAAIWANNAVFLNFSQGFTTTSGTCDTATQQWDLGTPPLAVTTIECFLSNPTAATATTVAG